MYYEDSTIEEVRSRNDIVSVIGSYVSLKRAGANYQGLCPFHSEKTPSFSVSPSRQTYKCFGCGKGGNVFTFLMEYENMSFPEALEALAERAGMTLPKVAVSDAQRKQANLRAELLELYKKAATYYYRKFYSEDGKYAREYIVGRGLSPETMKGFGIGYSDGHLYSYLKEEGYKDELLSNSGLFTFDERRGVNDKFFNRVMFPIFDASGKVIAFGGRVMGDALPKYLNSPETPIFDKSRNLYGLHLARKTRKPYMLLCEGYMDTIALHQAGFDNAVASLGTSLTGLQARLLSRYTKDVIITYDSDGAGQKAAVRAIPILAEAGIRARILNMAPYKDPDEFIRALGTEEYEKRIADASPSFDFEVKVIQSGYDLNEPQQKTRFHEAVADRILEFEDNLTRTNYMEAFCRDYHVDFKDFKAMVNKRGAASEFKKTENVTYKQEYAPERKKAAEDNRLRKSQRIVLTRCAEDPELFRKLREYLSPDDFEEGVYRTVAAEMAEQFDKKGRIDPAAIISRFESKEDQTEAAEICETTLVQRSDEQGSDIAKQEFAACAEYILLDSYDRKGKQARHAGDSAGMMKYMQLKKEVGKIKAKLLQ